MAWGAPEYAALAMFLAAAALCVFFVARSSIGRAAAFDAAGSRFKPEGASQPTLAETKEAIKQRFASIAYVSKGDQLWWGYTAPHATGASIAVGFASAQAAVEHASARGLAVKFVHEEEERQFMGTGVKGSDRRGN